MRKQHNGKHDVPEFDNDNDDDGDFAVDGLVYDEDFEGNDPDYDDDDDDDEDDDESFSERRRGQIHQRFNRLRDTMKSRGNRRINWEQFDF